MGKYLVCRLSAIGDVAMVLPLLYAVCRANPEHEFTLLTQPFLTDLVVNPPNNLEAMAIDIKGEEHNVWGVLRYAQRLRVEAFDVIVDLHDVLRTKLLRFASTCGRSTKVYALQKPRRERRRLLSHSTSSGERPSVPHMLALYRSILSRAGLCVPEDVPSIELSPQHREAIRREAPDLFSHSTYRLFGLAPFASTEAKTYDLELCREVLRSLSERGDVWVYLFGGGRKERAVLEEWASQYPRVTSLVGRLDMGGELAVMEQLELMISMDSANMHLASMLGVRVVSIWCGTHPSAGFLGMGQSLADCLQDEALLCRPCSIFGQVKTCRMGNMPCRRSLQPEQISNHLLG